MKNFFKLLTLTLVGSLLFPIDGFAAPGSGPPSELRRIVVFDEGVEFDQQMNAVLAAGGRQLLPLGIINAVAAVLPSAASERALEARFDVVRIDEDLEAHATSYPEIPWGVARVKAPDVWSKSTGAEVKVAIVDTGIQKDHPDLLACVRRVSCPDKSSIP